MGIHFPVENITSPSCGYFLSLLCLDCGTGLLFEAELRQLAKGDAAPAG
jgi:hypothetical protein